MQQKSQVTAAKTEEDNNLELAQETLRVPVIVKSYFKKIKVMSDKARKKKRKETGS